MWIALKMRVSLWFIVGNRSGNPDPKSPRQENEDNHREYDSESLFRLPQELAPIDPRAPWTSRRVVTSQSPNRFDDGNCDYDQCTFGHRIPDHL